MSPMRSTSMADANALDRHSAYYTNVTGELLNPAGGAVDATGRGRAGRRRNIPPAPRASGSSATGSSGRPSRACSGINQFTASAMRQR